MLMLLGHIFNWLGSNLLHRISISVHRHLLNDEEGQILQVRTLAWLCHISHIMNVSIPKVYCDTKAMHIPIHAVAT